MDNSKIEWIKIIEYNCDEVVGTINVFGMFEESEYILYVNMCIERRLIYSYKLNVRRPTTAYVNPILDVYRKFNAYTSYIYIGEIIALGPPRNRTIKCYMNRGIKLSKVKKDIITCVIEEYLFYGYWSKQSSVKKIERRVNKKLKLQSNNISNLENSNDTLTKTYNKVFDSEKIPRVEPHWPTRMRGAY